MYDFKAISFEQKTTGVDPEAEYENEDYYSVNATSVNFRVHPERFFLEASFCFT